MKVSNSEVQYELLFNTISEGVYLLDLNGRTQTSNPAAREMLGYTDAEFNGQEIHQLIHHSHADGSPYSKEECPLYAAFRDGKNHSGSNEVFWRKDGTCFPIEYSSAPIIVDGKIQGALVTFKNISRLKTAEKKLFEERQEFIDVLNGAPGVIARYDKNYINLYANKNHTVYFNVSPEQMKGQHISLAVGKERFGVIKPTLDRVFNGEFVDYERDLKTQNGEIRNTYVHFVPKWENDSIEGMYVFITDITELKRLQNERKIVEAKLMNASKMSALGEMASGIAHEINNPLAIILGKAEIISRQIMDPKAKKEEILGHLSRIVDTATRIAKIVRGLKTFSRNSENSPVERTSIQKIVQECVELCSQKFKTANVQLLVDIEQDFIIECKPVQISQILMNLLSNAHDAVEKSTDKWVKIGIHQVKDQILLEVSDNGLGVAADIAEKIMQPFFTTKEVGKGTGLGLSIALGIAQEHKGNLYLDQGSPKTKFVLSLPLN